MPLEIKNIVAAFRGMHVSPANHSYAWLPRKCDYPTDSRTKWSPCAAMLRRRPKNNPMENSFYKWCRFNSLKFIAYVKLSKDLSKSSKLILFYNFSPQLGSLNYPNYRNVPFQPSLTNRSASSGSNMSNQSEYENVKNYKRYDTGSQDSGFSSNNNMYNLTTQRKSHYESSDELKTPTHNESDSVFPDKQYSKHGSLDGSYRKNSSQQNYGSLERNTRRREQWNYRDRQHSDGDADVRLSELEPSRFGSKRNSQSEYDLTNPRNSVVEVPVQHEQSGGHHRRYKSVPWEDSASMEPSPVIKSPIKTKVLNDSVIVLDYTRVHFSAIKDIWVILPTKVLTDQNLLDIHGNQTL